MSLFDTKLIPQVAKGGIPRGFVLRPVEKEDYHKGLLKCLSVLTTIGEVTEEKWNELWEYWHSNKDTYYVVVIASPTKVAALGTVFIERKLIHECGKVGHIEDIAVAKEFQGGPAKLGLRLINALTQIGLSRGCYKVILDCSEHNVKFYEKCGYTRGGAEMVIRAQL